MDVLTLLQDPTAHWEREPPASHTSLDRLVAASPIPLPADYLLLLHYSNGGEGELALPPWWFQLWPVEEVMHWNEEYRVAEYAPGFIGFGSSGGGELLAFDTRSSQPWAIVMLPFVGMSEHEARRIAPDFATFIAALGRRREA
jgi:hypothetical protein